MQSGTKIAVVIVVYNISDLLPIQVGLIRKYSEDNVDIIVIDNSTIPGVIDAVKYWSKEFNLNRIELRSSDQNGSDSHVFACNFAYKKLRDDYDYFFFLDHDNFPIREFSIPSILENKIMGGLAQEKSKTYFWAGCVMWNNQKINHALIDFSVSHELGLDTGGQLYKVIETYGIDNVVLFNEKYYQNPYFNKSFYNFYATINDDMFMHFINSSGWNPSEENQERINSLISVLKERTD